MLLQPGIGKGFFRRFTGIGQVLARPFNWLDYDLKRSGIDAVPGVYVLMCVLNALVWAGVIAGLLLLLLFQRDQSINIIVVALPGIALFFAFFGLFVYYPRILIKKIADRIDRSLVYAIKDLLLQSSSGVCLFNGMVNVSKAGYGEISQEFDSVVREINAGINEVDALERMGLRTESRFVKRTIWQLVNVMRSGASIVGALRSVAGSLILFEQKLIRDFTQELNLWSLVYMIFAVIAPTLGTTLLIVLSAFGGAGINESLFIAVILVCFFVQASIVGFVKNRRPLIHG